MQLREVENIEEQPADKKNNFLDRRNLIKVFSFYRCSRQLILRPFSNTQRRNLKNERFSKANNVVRIRKSIPLSRERLLSSRGIGNPASLSGGPTQSAEEVEDKTKKSKNKFEIPEKKRKEKQTGYGTNPADLRNGDVRVLLYPEG